jgi:NADH:ubiquinone oxidoreductase subunit H
MQCGLPPLSFRRSRAALGLLAALVLPPACQRSEAPELLSVHRLEPGRAAVGDRLTITGDGFPEGRPATVTFRGDLYRPGATPERDVQIVAHAVQSGRNALVIPLDAALEGRFVGRSGAVHTTFRGDVRVAFDPSAAGLSGIYGRVRGVRFDVLPTRAPHSGDAETEAPTTSAFLGFSAIAEPEGNGLRLTAVAPDGRVAAAGLRAGDVLVDFDGVTVLSEVDLRARGGQQTAEVVVERDGRALPALSLDVEGLAPLGPSALARVGGVLAVVSVILVVLATRLSFVLKWIPRALDFASGKGPQPGSRRAAGRAVDALVLPIADGPGLAVAGLVVLVAVLVGLGRLGMGRSVFSSDLDLILATLSVSGGLLCTRFVSGGGGRGGRWSLRAALLAFVASLGCVAPAIIGVGGAILASGRFVIAEMVANQGAAPWRWAAARNPGLTALSILLLASAALESENGGPLASAGLPSSQGARPSMSRILVRLAEWSYLWVTSALAVVIFFGGWRLPGVTSVVQESSRALSAVGTGLLVVKVALVVLGVGAIRSGLSRVFVEHVAVTWAKWAIPFSLALAALAAAWGTALEGPRSAPLGDLCGVAALLLGALGAGYLVFAAPRARAGAAGATSVNPWL